MKHTIVATIAGALFGLGMMTSGMANPARVLGFFDVMGDWDATLAWVMAGALVPMAIAWRVRTRMRTSVLGAPLPAPPSGAIDRRLVVGGAIFGLGWGIVGLCPGAVVPALGHGGWPVMVFAGAMFASIAVTRWWLGRSPARDETTNALAAPSGP